MTRKEKREILSENNFFGEFLKIKNHFFKEIFVKLKKVKDVRQTGKVIYTPDIMLFMIIMKNCCSIISMNKTGRNQMVKFYTTLRGKFFNMVRYNKFAL